MGARRRSAWGKGGERRRGADAPSHSCTAGRKSLRPSSGRRSSPRRRPAPRRGRTASSAPTPPRRGACAARTTGRTGRARGRPTAARRPSPEARVEPLRLWRASRGVCAAASRRPRAADGAGRSTAGTSASARPSGTGGEGGNETHIVELGELGARDTAAEVGEEALVLGRRVDLALLDLRASVPCVSLRTRQRERGSARTSMWNVSLSRKRRRSGSPTSIGCDTILLSADSRPSLRFSTNSLPKRPVDMGPS